MPPDMEGMREYLEDVVNGEKFDKSRAFQLDNVRGIVDSKSRFR